MISQYAFMRTFISILLICFHKELSGNTAQFAQYNLSFPKRRNIMINTATKSTGVMNRDSILSINKPEPQSVKNQGNIMTLIKSTGGGVQNPVSQTQNRPPQPPQYGQSQGQSQNRPSQHPQLGQSQNQGQQPPYGQPQNRPPAQPSFGQSQNRPPRQPQNVQPALTAEIGRAHV